MRRTGVHERHVVASFDQCFDERPTHDSDPPYDAGGTS